jgi:hypothetical protein
MPGAPPQWPPAGRRWGRSCSLPTRQQPHPAPSLGCTSSTPPARRHQLLSQQIAQAAGALDRPRPLRPCGSPPHEPFRLPSRGPHPQAAQQLHRCAGRHRRVRALVRAIPIITAAISTPAAVGDGETVAACTRARRALASVLPGWARRCYNHRQPGFWAAKRPAVGDQTWITSTSGMAS